MHNGRYSSQPTPSIMNPKFFFLGIFLCAALSMDAVDLADPTNGITPATPYDPVKDPMLDAETKDMINTWPQGLPTNGLFCAIQIIDSNAQPKKHPIGYVNAVNTTTNFYRSLLNLPQEASMQIDLFDSKGNPVEKTAKGQSYKPWSQEQIEQWRLERIKTNPRRLYYEVWGMNCQQVGSLTIPDLFELKEPGGY